MTDQVSIVVTSGQEELILRLDGELDIATVDACRTDLTDAIDDRRRNRAPTMSGGRAALTMVVLDLSELTFFSACGLRMIADLTERLARQHITTVVAVRPNGITCRLVHLAGFDRRLTIIDAAYRRASIDGRRQCGAAADTCRRPTDRSVPTEPDAIVRIPRSRMRSVPTTATSG